MDILEVSLFIIAVVGFIALGIWKSRDEDTSGEQGAFKAAFGRCIATSINAISN